MAKRLTATEKWDKVWFRRLRPIVKCFWIYMLDRCNHAGIWEVDFTAAEFYIGSKLNQKEILEAVGSKVEEIDGGKQWFVPGFIEFQYGILNPAVKAHLSAIRLLSAAGLLSRVRVSEGLANSSLTVKDKDKDKSKDKVKDKDTGKPVRARDVKNFRPNDEAAILQDEFAKLFRSCFTRETCVPFILSEGEVYAKKYGKAKLFAMMQKKAGGYWDWVKKDLDNPRNKASKREAVIMRPYHFTCPACKKSESLENASSVRFVCPCGKEIIIPGDTMGLISEDLSDDVVYVLAEIEKVKKA